jgi:hypothetical protein
MFISFEKFINIYEYIYIYLKHYHEIVNLKPEEEEEKNCTLIKKKNYSIRSLYTSDTRTLPETTKYRHTKLILVRLTF